MNKYQEALDFIIAATNGGDGMVKELNALQELVEKATPKKPLDIQTPVVKWGVCPICKGRIGYQLGGRPNRVLENENYCSDCGQAIDWE